MEFKVLGSSWLTPTVMRIRLQAVRSFEFRAGQALSLQIPESKNGSLVHKPRFFSLSSPPEEGKKRSIYELCVRYEKGGVASEFLANVKPGDVLQGAAPYGDFFYQLPSTPRHVCFISSGTGIAPIRSIVFSEDFRRRPTGNALVISGVRTEKERLFASDFANAGVTFIEAVSQPGPGWSGFKGRVTDYLRTLPKDWAWSNTEFYICGNRAMVSEVVEFLHSKREISGAFIHFDGHISIKKNV